jgi:hypothetical protein
MAETVRLTRVENLPEEQREFIEEMMRERPRPTGLEMSTQFEKEFGIHIEPSVFYSHMARRVQASLRRTQELLEEKRAKAKLIGLEGLPAAVQADIFEAMQTMTGQQLIVLMRAVTDLQRLQVEKQNADTNRMNAETDKAVMAVKLKEAEGKIARVQEVMGGVESAEKPKPEEVVKDIRGIFGMS